MSDEPKNPNAVALGKLGGQATGDSKRRSPEHYARISRLGADRRWKGNAHDRRKANRAQGGGTKAKSTSRV